ncbi:hypothetical protein ACEQ8H_000799 [Pleosporales sp. CAS-2024a]
MAYSTDAARWRALRIRDAEANGQFVYSVRTTNIYCRPTCPARLARRANIGFFKTALEAEADGYRACKRCKPNTVVQDPQERAVAKACMLIDEAVKNSDPKSFRLQELAKNVGLTPRYLHKIFKDKTGMTPKEWANARTTPQTSCTTSPDANANPINATNFEVFDWNPLDYNNFNALVDFDIDEGATLGYNLSTGASQAVSMGYGNAIDTEILYELWTSEYNSNDKVLLCSDDLDSNILSMSDAPIAWRTEEHIPFTSTFELDANTLLLSDSVLF